jgi:hypothetical protein
VKTVIMMGFTAEVAEYAARKVELIPYRQKRGHEPFHSLICLDERWKMLPLPRGS